MINKFIDRIRKKDSITSELKTQPLYVNHEQTAQPPVIFRPLQLVVGTGQSVGIQRDHNEDALFAFNAILSDGTSELPYGIFIVADGMGGHQHGEIASGIAVRVMFNYLTEHVFLPLMSPDSQNIANSIQEILESGVAKVQEAVQKKVPGGGTTLTVALIIGEQVNFAHVGDSRAYFIYPENRIEVKTHDHSLVQRLFDIGHITKEEAESHPQKNVLYRAIGQNEPFKPDLSTYPIPHPGYLLLCSDGLWGQVSNEKLCETVIASPLPSIGCHKLIELANEAGGPDNISAILVQILD